MRPEHRAAREEEIAAAAYEVLAENGYAGTTMLAVAKRAKASNETLYRWFGDKTGLFAALISMNAAKAKALLDRSVADLADPVETLGTLGPVLLQLLTGARAVALNRAAAADPTGELGRLLARMGRDTVAPMIARVMAHAMAKGRIRADTADGAAALYIDLLVGDMQIRRVIGALPQPPPEACAARAQQALDRFLRLSA